MSQEALNKCNKVIVRRSYFLVRVSNTVVSPLEGKGFCVYVRVCVRTHVLTYVCVCVCVYSIYISFINGPILFVFIFYIAFKHFNIL
jgi:hypothetical protein